MNPAQPGAGRLGVGLFILLLFALVLVPFFLLEDHSFELTARLMGESQSAKVVFALVVLGLALDIFLPLPSTIIAASAAVILGGVPAFFAVWIGLGLGCVLGYEFGATAGQVTLRRMASEKQRRRLAWMENRIGLGALVVFRPVPVLAEVSVLMAGSAGVARTRFYPLVMLANAGVALIYVLFSESLGLAPLV